MRDNVVKIARLSSCKNFVGIIRERSLYMYMSSLTFSQWRDLRMVVICVDLGALTTARARVLNALEPVKLTNGVASGGTGVRAAPVRTCQGRQMGEN